MLGHALNQQDILADLRITKTPRLDGTDIVAKRAEILKYFHDSFSLYESLFDCLSSDKAFYHRANSLRHPLIFYFGHTAVFFVNKLNVAGLIDERIDPVLESLVAIGVDEMSWDDLNENHYDWPSVGEMRAYRAKTRALVDRYIRNIDFTLPIQWDDPLWIVMMGIEHERIHLETSAVLIRELPLEMVQPHPLWSQICTEMSNAPDNSLLPVTGGIVQMGKGSDHNYYGWDNEYGHIAQEVQDFAASQYLVSNQEFLQFVEDGGYSAQKYWSEEGWQWVSYSKSDHPVYWRKSGKTYHYRAMLEEIAMPWNWPADINQLEAKAFCNWKSEKTGKTIRMPTEAEWYALRALCDEDQPTWSKAPGNINLEGFMSACPVDRFAFHNGFFDIIGNVWQWTETAIDGFEGFAPHPVYDDFSTPTFDGKHNIFKGGCWVSTGNYALKDSRYAFRRHFFQYAGLRYVEAAPLQKVETNMYENDAIISQYIEFHYGDELFGVPNFPKACADICLETMQGRKTGRALDIGCATGRASFELAKAFDHVDALDFSARLIEAPSALQAKGVQRYTIADEGELVSYKEVRLSDFLDDESAAQRVSFMQGDACNLAKKFTGYDLVFAGNLIDRLYDPALFLESMKQRMNKGGLLVITSPYTWLEEFTERSKWLGGYKDAGTGENVTTLEGIGNTLAPQFRQLGVAQDVPFTIRETRRKHQHTIAELSIWEFLG